MDPLDGRDVYAAEKILRTRIKKGKTEYLIKWKGWPNSYNSWEPVDNVLNENLFTESGFAIPTGFKGKGKRGAKRSLRGRKRKAKESSVESDQSEDEIDSISDKDSSRSETPVRTGTASRPGPSQLAAAKEPSPAEERPQTPPIKRRKRVSKLGKKKTVDAQPVADEPSCKPELSNDSAADDGCVIGDSEANQVDSGDAPSNNAPPVVDSVDADSDTPLEIVSEPSKVDEEEPEKPVDDADASGVTTSQEANNEDSKEIENTADKVEAVSGDSTDNIANEKDPKETIADDPSEEEERKVKINRAAVYNGRSGSVQVISNGQEQMINRLAFVIDNTPDLSKTTEQLQIHTYGAGTTDRIRMCSTAVEAKNETRFWKDANNGRHESFQYNSSHVVTEVTYNGETASIIEF